MLQPVNKSDVLQAEVLWAVKILVSHYSQRSSDYTNMLFKSMLSKLKEPGTKFVISFDESLNKILQQEQMDMVIRFWDKTTNQVVSRYFDTSFGPLKSDRPTEEFQDWPDRIKVCKSYTCHNGWIFANPLHDCLRQSYDVHASVAKFWRIYNAAISRH